MSIIGTLLGSKAKSKEQQILQQFGRGDDSAMDLLYTEYASLLTGVCARYIPGDDDRKDVLQESLVKAYLQMGTFSYRGPGSLKAWLVRIVINESLRFLHKKTAEQTVSLDSLVAEPADKAVDDPGVNGVPDDALAGMIASLPEGYRQVFNLFAIDGKSHKEIAALLGIKPDTSASQYYKAKKMLARMIKDYQKKDK